MQHIESTMPSADGQVELYWQTWQPGGEPKGSVVIVHGLGEHSGRYAHIAEALVDAGYACYALDYQGFGQSGGKRGYVPGFVNLLDDLGLLIERAHDDFPDTELFLYGHSMGGIIVLNYALRRPAGLAGVVSSGVGLIPTLSPVKMFLARLLGSVTPGLTLTTDLDVSGLSRDPAVVEAYENDPLNHDQAATGWSKQTLAAASWTLAHADQLTVPVLLIHGGEDTLTASEGSRQFHAGAPQGLTTYIEYEGFYHEVHNEPEKARVLSDVVSWLDAQV